MERQKEIRLPTTPAGWAIHLSKLVKLFHEIHGLDRFPIRVASVAQEYSRNAFPRAPITLVRGERLDKKFEGALIPNSSGNGEWGIFYNTAITSEGRRNFTLGHELGHYLLHRQLSGDPIYCAKNDMWTWESAYGQMEAEANEFASYLLMPLDDFRIQTNGLGRASIKDFELIRARYEVSLTAAILKWLAITPKRAMIVVSRDGFIDWSRSSPSLFRSGVYFKARKDIIPLPGASLAATKPSDGHVGKMLSAGIWATNEDVFESVIFSDYHDMAISLLIFSDEPPLQRGLLLPEYDSEPVMDTFDKFCGARTGHN
jgi:hypothetical protein